MSEERSDVDRTLDLVRQQRDEAAKRMGVADFTRREAAWRVDVKDDDGKRYEGVFRSRMPSLHEQDEISLVAARLSGGIPWASIPSHAQARLLMYATMAVVLVERPESGWFADPSSFMSETVPAAVYAKIREHYTCFFRSRGGQAGGPGAHGDGGGPAAPLEGREVQPSGTRG